MTGGFIKGERSLPSVQCIVVTGGFIKGGRSLPSVHCIVELCVDYH